MKKLMILAAAAMTACAVNASAFSWGSTGSRGAGAIYDGAETPAVLKGATAYLLTTADITQADLLAGIRKGDFTVASKAISGATATTTDAGQVGVTSFDYGSSGSTYSFYYAIVNGDNLLISTTKDATYPVTGTTAFSWTEAAGTTFTKDNYGTADFGNAGWYSTAAVPEPTSGLLLLLGMAGLALRRRRA